MPLAEPLVAAPFALAGFGGLVQRTDFHVREIDIPIPNLPQDLQGLRILQLSDIHLGPFLEESELARVIDESRNLRPHLVVGDRRLDFHGRRSARRLPAADRAAARRSGDSRMHGKSRGVCGCGSDIQRSRARRLGIDFLRMRARPMRFGDATLNIAGVDYQPMSDKSKYHSRSGTADRAGRG